MIRFGRSLITASGIFLGIAFLSTVLTQSLMQWPVAEKVDTGMVKVDGQVNGPGLYDAWEPIAPEKAAELGFGELVIERTTNEKGNVSLSDIAKKMEDARHANKMVEIIGSEITELGKVDKALYSDDNAGADIALEDAIAAGVPERLAKELAEDGRSFKGSVLADTVKAHPGTLRKWERVADKLAPFAAIDKKDFEKIAEDHRRTVADIIAVARETTEDANLSNLMIVNMKGKKISMDLENSGGDAKTKLQAGDYLFVPDINTYYRTIWLVVMSLLVSAVGITNAMLMSVTERFKEIGTMKCLGAMDRFVVTLFMMESGMMGIVASALGWLIGFGLMVLVAGFTKGWDVVFNIGVVDALRTLVASLGIGLLLTILATIAPAKRAADMPPAMALRSEI